MSPSPERARIDYGLFVNVAYAVEYTLAKDSIPTEFGDVVAHSAHWQILRIHAVSHESCPVFAVVLSTVVDRVCDLLDGAESGDANLGTAILHGGLWKALDEQLPALVTALRCRVMDEAAHFQIVFCGHSGAGAMAQMALYWLWMQTQENVVDRVHESVAKGILPSVSVYTFGAPYAFRSVPRDFLVSFGSKIHNFVHGFDVVPRLFGHGLRFSLHQNAKTFSRLISSAFETYITGSGLLLARDLEHLSRLGEWAEAFEPIGLYYYGREEVGTLEGRFVTGMFGRGDPLSPDTAALVGEMYDWVVRFESARQVLEHHSVRSYVEMAEKSKERCDAAEQCGLAGERGFVSYPVYLTRKAKLAVYDRLPL